MSATTFGEEAIGLPLRSGRVRNVGQSGSAVRVRLGRGLENDIGITVMEWS